MGNIVQYHHERLDGSGYPYGFETSRLTFEDELLMCINVYRESLSHERAMDILRGQADSGKMNREIVEDIDRIFS